MRVELEDYASFLEIEVTNTRLSIIDSDVKSDSYDDAAYACVDVVNEGGQVIENLYSRINNCNC